MYEEIKMQKNIPGSCMRTPSPPVGSQQELQLKLGVLLSALCMYYSWKTCYSTSKNQWQWFSRVPTVESLNSLAISQILPWVLLDHFSSFHKLTKTISQENFKGFSPRTSHFSLPFSEACCWAEQHFYPLGSMFHQ